MSKRILIVLAVAAAATAVADNAMVDYPAAYRDWKHVKSMVIQEGHPLYESFGGIHHIYANDKAVEGYRSGKWPNGAVIAFDLLAAPAADGAITEGERKVLGVMQRDAKKFASTGGWGFEGFAGGDPKQRVVGSAAATACYQCHTQRADHGYVFSALRD